VADKLTSFPVALLLTVRTGESAGVEAIVDRLALDRHLRRVVLHRLPPDDVAQVVLTSLGGEAVPREVLDAVVVGSDGLPFLAEELLGTLLATGTLVRQGAKWDLKGELRLTVPGSFALDVRHRMDSMVETSRAVVQAAAVLGEVFDWRTLGPITALDERIVTVALRDGASLHLLEERRPGGVFRFRHALTREAVLDSLLMPERAELARRALDLIPGTTADDLALRASLAQLAGDRKLAHQLLVAAAASALSRGALASSVRFATRADELAEGLEQQIAANSVLFEARVASRDTGAAFDLGQRLMSRLDAIRAGSDSQAQLHLRLADAAVAATDWQRAADYVEAATELLGNGAPDEVGARTELLRAHVALGQHQIDEALAAANRARRLALAAEAPVLVSESLELLGRVARLDDLDAAERLFSDAVAQAELGGSPLRRVQALTEAASIDLIRLGAPDRLLEARQLAMDLGAPAIAAVAELHLALLHCVHFEPEESRAAASAAAELSRRFGLGLLGSMAQLTVGCIDAMGGDRSSALSAFEAVRPYADAEIEAIGRGEVLANAALATEDRRWAMVEMDLAEDMTPENAPARVAPHEATRALLLALEGDDRAPDTVDRLSASGRLTHWVGGLVDHAAGVLAGRAGDAARAEELVARADRRLDRAPWHRHLALRLVAEAAIADGWGDPVPWLQQALAFFERVGLEELSRACVGLLKQAGGSVPRRSRQLQPELARLGVTLREADVLALVALGMSTKDIAERLYLSPRTVEKHVERLLTKTATANRTQLAALAARLGVAATPTP
jgi:DNA-binding CsgD family transcriptional regulator